ncbi:RluA family pseudouridine synthase [Marvinbryantia formatexigens]|nr:RluA family pseudouridine synthase [Marvinbryantia formatexigens]UWO23236.1 RluA family pseudouridine synthase [Marvinbryantia formatexigens DSM 14469]SDG60411.1 23S rRNA pseudouridine1911/1915/1917 synthase [Marvinbryantia formatexigens]
MPDIIYEDKQLLVCRKPAGLAVQNASFGRMDLESMVRNYLMEKSGKPNPYLGVVHRLDQPVQGLLVFAKTPAAAAALSAQVQDGRMTKEYLAVVCGKLPEKEGELVHFLKKEPAGNCSRAVGEKTPGAKRAELSYRVLAEADGRALVRIKLKTGRHHQIRVQMVACGAPLYGDAKYNPGAQRGERLALCADRLSFVHPAGGKRVEFTCRPDNFPAPWEG